MIKFSLNLLRLITPPSPHRSHFIQFYEDAAADVAVLVIGSKRSLTVYDMMTMEMIWQINGKFHACAVATTATAIPLNGSKV